MALFLNKCYYSGVTLIGHKYLRRAVKLFFEMNPIGPILGLSNEILCILVAQGAAKLPKVKFGVKIESGT